ncbi:MAG: sulfite exporter TauE/SafE family protein [Desulfovibrionaceae bacterium]
MDHASLFWIALQSSLVLGLIHGVSPCGHSWLVLAPFTTGMTSGRRVAVLTLAFLLGTSAACLLLGVTLGLAAAAIPPAVAEALDILMGLALMGVGLVLMIRPEWLHRHDDHDDHHHDHDHDDDHDHHPSDHDHSGPACGAGCGLSPARRRWLRLGALGLFLVGFVNMVLPCPTAAVMYGYALNSGDWRSGALVFGAYAAGTACSVGAVVWGLHRAAALARRLDRPGIETAILRGSGLVTLAFGAVGLVWGH